MTRGDMAGGALPATSRHEKKGANNSTLPPFSPRAPWPPSATPPQAGFPFRRSRRHHQLMVSDPNPAATVGRSLTTKKSICKYMVISNVLCRINSCMSRIESQRTHRLMKCSSVHFVSILMCSSWFISIHMSRIEIPTHRLKKCSSKYTLYVYDFSLFNEMQ